MPTKFIRIAFIFCAAALTISARAAQQANGFANDGVEIKARYENFHHVSVTISAPKIFVGKSVKVVSTDGETPGVLQEKDGRARAVLALKAIPAGKSAATLRVFIDGELRATSELPNLSELRIKAFMDSNYFFDQYVFSGNEFPSGHFGKADVIENLYVPFDVSVSFFDNTYQKVKRAEKPGRYGAVATVTLRDGRSMMRRLTLFRLPEGAAWSEADALALNSENLHGLDAARLKRAKEETDGYYAKLWKTSGEQADGSAQILAGLYEPEMPLKARGPFGPLISANQKWWYGLHVKHGLRALQYAVSVPKTETTERVPLLVFLHGSEERGYELAQVQNNGPFKSFDGGRELPFLIVAPQCPPCELWNPWQLRELISEICEKYPVDQDCVYLTGLSLGGFGAWHAAAEFPELFAGVAPLAGKSSVLDAPRLKDLPVWNFHGKLDEAVPEKFSEEMVRALVQEHGRVKFTLFANRGHQCWDSVYGGPELYEWLLKQKRGAPEQSAPANFESATIIDDSK